MQKSEEEGKKWIRLAADQGHSDSQLVYGLLLAIDENVPECRKRSFEYLKMAAEQDNPDAQFLVCMRFFLGGGVEKSAEEAAGWLLKARDNGSEEAAELIRAVVPRA